MIGTSVTIELNDNKDIRAITEVLLNITDSTFCKKLKFPGPCGVFFEIFIWILDNLRSNIKLENALCMFFRKTHPLPPALILTLPLVLIFPLMYFLLKSLKFSADQMKTNWFLFHCNMLFYYQMDWCIVLFLNQLFIVYLLRFNITTCLLNLENKEKFDESWFFTLMPEGLGWFLDETGQ